MSGFEKIRIKELGKIVTGNTPVSTDETNYGGKYPFIKPTDMTIDQKHVFEYEETYSEKSYQRFKRSYIPKGATGVVTIGTVGEKMFQAHEDCFTNQSVNCIISDDKCFDKDYIFYLMKFNLPKVEGANPGTASGRHHVSKSNFSSIKVDVTKDLFIQKKIAKTLSNYDDLIENNLKRIKLLEESARLTYEEWFLRFKIDGEKLEIDSETGLPFGWKFEQLGDFITFRKGKKVEELFEHYAPGLTKLLLLKSLSSQEYNYVKQERQVIVDRNDILMLMDGARSSAVFYAENGAVGSTLAWLKIKNIPMSYVYHYLDTRYKLLEINNTGAAIPHANKSFINKMKIVIPSEDTFNSWNNNIEKINYEVYNLKDQNKLLKEARDILLPRLMTGMIDVENMEIAV